MTRRTLALLMALLMAAALVLPVMAEEVKEGTPVSGKTLTISDYFDPPPAINGNVLTPSGDDGNMEYMYDRLIEYAPVPETHYAYFLAESYHQDDQNRTVVVLRENAKWSDGEPITAQDVLATYHMRFMVNDSVWQYLTSVEALDDRTVAFTWHSYSDLLPVMAFNLRIDMGHKEYGKWADEAAKYIPNRVWDETQKIYSVPADDQQKLIDLREDCFKWLPDVTTMRATGPYTCESVNANEIMLKKNPNYWNADKVLIDNVRIQRYVSAEAFLTTVMQGGYDSEPHGLTPDLFQQLEANNPDMVTMWVPDMGQPAFQFNVLKYPLDIVQVRQALGFIIDRELLLEIAEPGTMPPDYYATGLSPLWRDKYMTDELKAQLTEYVPDYEKADELLTSIGWTRGSDGYWQNEKGETVTIEFSSMNSWPIFFACGEAASLMADEYGIKSTFNAMELSSYWDYINNGEHQVSCDFRGGSQQRGPWEAYSGIYLWSNNRIGLNPQGSPTDLKIEITALDGSVYVIRELLADMFYGTPEEAAEAIRTMMKLHNEQMFVLPIGEKYAPMKIHNPKLAGYPLDGNHWAWYMGHMRAYGKLLKYGYLFYTE
jgi:peptide/nickel transport system substrate-binding protein